MLGAKTSQHCELDQTLFTRGAYTESDNAPAQKIGSGYTRLCVTNVQVEAGHFNVTLPISVGMLQNMNEYCVHLCHI